MENNEATKDDLNKDINDLNNANKDVDNAEEVNVEDVNAKDSGTEADNTNAENNNTSAKESDAESDDSTENIDNSGKKADKKDEMIKDLTDKYQRVMAEFDNFRKRSEREKSSMYGMGTRDVVEKILPVLDNFERGFASIDEEAKKDPFVQGMDMIYNQFVSVLNDLGVEEIKALGEEFNPDFHNAVMHVEDENAGDNEVIEVLQKGYIYKDIVVRHSMVKVAN